MQSCDYLTQTLLMSRGNRAAKVPGFLSYDEASNSFTVEAGAGGSFSYPRDQVFARHELELAVMVLN